MIIPNSYIALILTFHVLLYAFPWLESKIHQENIIQSDSLVFVRNSDGVPETMSFDELLTALKGEKQHWDSGKKVKIALMKTSTVTGKLVTEHIYNMSTNQFQKYWLTKVFQGYGISPKFFTSVEELKNYIKSTPGTISILKSDDCDGLDRIEVISNPN